MQTCVISVYGHSRRTRLLSELVGMLTHRQVEVCAMSATFDGDLCTVQLRVAVPDDAAAQMLVKRLNRVIGVLKAIRHDTDSTHHRSALLVSVESTDGPTRTGVLELARAFDAEVLEIAAGSVTLAFIGTPRREREFTALLKPYGILATANSGPMAVRTARCTGQPVRAIALTAASA
jgi:acetolactate synthase small subunit